MKTYSTASNARAAAKAALKGTITDPKEGEHFAIMSSQPDGRYSWHAMPKHDAISSDGETVTDMKTTGRDDEASARQVARYEAVTGVKVALAPEPKRTRTKLGAKLQGERPARENKGATLIAMLRREGGATSEEMQTASGWQPHSVRGFLAGTVKKAKGLGYERFERADGAKAYRIVEEALG